MPRARKKKRTAKKPDDASVFAARAEGTSPERRGDSESAVRIRSRTSLGDGVVKPEGGRIAWPSFDAASIGWTFWPAVGAAAAVDATS